MKNLDKDYKKKILINAFTYRKTFILSTLNYFINDTITPIPLLSTEEKINGVDFKGYLEKKTKLKGRSLSTFYYNTLMELKDDGIIKIISKNGKKLRYFTEIGFRVILFFNSLLNFFGEANILDILDILRNPVRKKIFLNVLAKIIDLNRIQANKQSIFSLLDKDTISKDSNLEKKILTQIYLTPENIENYIKETTGLPASIDRREKLLLSIEKSYRVLLGNNLKQKKIQEFKQLQEIFESWDLLPVSDYTPKTRLDRKISNIINEKSKPLYALNIGSNLRLCSEFHNNKKIALDLEGIQIFVELLDNFLALSFKDLRIIEISLPLESDSFPKIFWIPIKDGTFLVTAYKPLYWSDFKSSLQFSMQWSESPDDEDNAYSIIRKSNKDNYPKDSDKLLATATNFLQMILILVDDIYFNKLNQSPINFQFLRENRTFDANLWDSFESAFKDKVYNPKDIEIEQNPIFNSDLFCYFPIPKIKIYYDQHMIKCGVIIKEGTFYFSLYSTNNIASPEYNEIIKLLKKF